MELSTSLNVLYDPKRIGMEQTVERLAAVGFEAFDWNLCDWLFDGSPFIGDQWQEWCRGVHRQVKASGVRFGQGHSPMFEQFEDSDRVRWMTEMTRRSLEAAAIVEVPWLVFHTGQIPRGCFDDEYLVRVRQRNLDWFGDLLPLAERAGVGIAIENTSDAFRAGRSYGSIPAELVDLVDALASPLVGVCWDTGHGHLQGLKQSEALRALGGRLKCLHVADNDGRSDQHVLPFYGTVDWPDVMAGLRALGYDAPFSFETHASFARLPWEVRDSALRHAVDLGRYLLALDV